MSVEMIFYRGRGDAADRAVRWITGSIYSHCELLAPYGRGAVRETIAASKRDGNRVRRGRIDIGSGHWDVLRFAGPSPDEVWARAEDMIGMPYDILGAVLSVTPVARIRPGRWFCSELCAYALGYRRPEVFSPGALAAASLMPGLASAPPFVPVVLTKE